MKKCATIAIIGRPSSGKSTLLNTICEQKISITSSSPQTTRNAIRGIYNDSRGQLIFTDTPGYHLSEQNFNQKLQEIAVNSLRESDLILYLVDGKRPAGKEENQIALMVKQSKVPVVVCINKNDITNVNEIEEAKLFLKNYFDDLNILTISGKNDEGVDEILIELFKNAPEGPLLFSEDTFTDQNLEFRISEIIREKAISNTKDEIPHSIYVEVYDLEYDKSIPKVWVRAFINVERESQKGIIVGKAGNNIKRIRVESFKDIKRIFPGSKLEIDLRVRCAGKWKSNSFIISNMIK